MLVYHKRGYIEIVGRAAEMSMQNSVEEVEAPTEYTLTQERYMYAHVALFCHVL